MMALKPSIPEIDNASPSKQNAFLSTITSQFPTQIGSFKNTLIQQLGSSLNPAKFLGMAGLN